MGVSRVPLLRLLLWLPGSLPTWPMCRQPLNFVSCLFVHTHATCLILAVAIHFSTRDSLRLGIHYRGVQWEGCAADGDSIIINQDITSHISPHPVSTAPPLYESWESGGGRRPPNSGSAAPSSRSRDRDALGQGPQLLFYVLDVLYLC